MGTIPAPNIAQDAMQISQAPANAMAEYARVANLKQQTASLQQQQQEQQIAMEMQRRQLADQDALTKTIAGFNPATDSINDIPKKIVANGGSGQSALQAQAGLVQQRRNLAQLSDEQFAEEQKKADLVQGVHDQVSQAPPEQKQNLYSQGLQRLQAAGVDVSKEPPQYPGDDVFAQHLPAIRLHSAVLAEAEKDRELTTKEQQAQTEQQKANAADWKDFPQLGVSLNTRTGEQRTVGGAGGLMPPGMMEAKYVALQQKENAGQPLDPSDSAWKKAYEKFKTLVPQFNMNMAITGGGLAPGAAGAGAGAGAAGGGATPQAPKNAPGGWASPDGKTLNNVPAPIRAEVQQVLEYRRADPSITQRGPVGQAINAWVAQLDPQHDATTFGARNKILNEYVKDAGSGEIGAINTALGHLGDLYTASEALNQSNLPLLHQIASKWGVVTGGTPEATYESILHRVGPEMTKAYLKSGGTEGERGSNENDFALSKGQAQIQNNIFESANLLNSKLASKRNDWEKTFQPYRDRDHFDARFVTPDAQQMLTQLGSQSSIAKAQRNSPKIQVGQTVSIKGKSMTITAVHPDGSFDAK